MGSDRIIRAGKAMNESMFQFANIMFLFFFSFFVIMSHDSSYRLSVKKEVQTARERERDPLTRERGEIDSIRFNNYLIWTSIAGWFASLRYETYRY